jgi:polyphosphate kinase
MPKLIDNEKSRLFNRELSWLSFNDRVLEEAADPSTPLLERMKFLAIVSSNLEEFFRVRVAALFRKHDLLKTNKKNTHYLRDGFEIAKLLKTIRTRVLEQKNRQALVYEQVCLALKNEKLSIEERSSSLSKEIFEEHVLSHLLPLRVGSESEIPPLKGGVIYLLVAHTNSYSLIEIPSTLRRFYVARSQSIFLTDQLIFFHTDILFRSQEVKEIFSFKISRDATIDLSEDSLDYLEEMEEGLKHRDQGEIVRLEVDSVTLSPAVEWLQKKLNVSDERLYQISLPLDLKSLAPLAEIKKTSKSLRYQYVSPRRPTSLPKDLHKNRFFKALEKQDQLLHHPFSSFDPVADLVRFASEDPKVTRICQTLYRTSGKSPILESLVHAAQKGKNVLALIEVKARFDEANNLRWARALEKAGVRVIYGTPEIKVHAKLTYVERKGPKTGDPTREYVHIGTGNYHPTTARFYTDLGVLSANKDYCSEAKTLFDLFEQMDDADDYSLLNDAETLASHFKSWAIAPAKLHKHIIKWIENETLKAQQGNPAYIHAKMNGLVEIEIIEALYRASQAGVKIDLLVRGMCCLRPGLAGLSENIRVRSIIDKYLEHSRIFIFGNGDDPKAWISSADWMPRNLFRRIELAVPILDKKILNYLLQNFWPTYASDNVKARECLPDGRYIREYNNSGVPLRAQFEFEKQDVPSF